MNAKKTGKRGIRSFNINTFQSCNNPHFLVWRMIKTAVILPCQKDKEMNTEQKTAGNRGGRIKFLLRIFCGYINNTYFCCPKLNGLSLITIQTKN